MHFFKCMPTCPHVYADGRVQQSNQGMVVRIRFKEGLVGKTEASGGFQNTSHVSGMFHAVHIPIAMVHFTCAPIPTVMKLSTGEMKLVDYERRSMHGRAATSMLCSCVYNEEGDLMGVVQVQ